MKIKNTLISPILLFICVHAGLLAQEAGVENALAYPAVLNDANNPCINIEEYVRLEKEIAANNKLLGLTPAANKTFSTLFAWPLKMANNLNDCGYYVVVNYVDQDATAGIKDYMCGSSTYGGHTGDDIAIEPYPFYKMDSNMVDVIAAAPGTIISKTDGNIDKNCAKNNLTANEIVIQHADGSYALYYHMKKNTLTAKTVGQTVVAGEFLGKVGSSGSSTLPHLHFEVWAGSTFSTRNEAYAGPCNILNANSWWANQKTYKEPSVIKVQVNKVAMVLPACPATETPNEDSCFIAPGTAKFYAWIRNDTIGMINKMRIINPNNTTFASWTYTSTTTFNLACYNFTYTLPSAAGSYTFESVFNGDTCRKPFKVNCNPSQVPEINSESALQIYPNPGSGQFFIRSENKNSIIEIINVLGEKVYRQAISDKGTVISIDISNNPKGIYFIKASSGTAIMTRKIIVQ